MNIAAHPADVQASRTPSFGWAVATVAPTSEPPCRGGAACRSGRLADEQHRAVGIGGPVSAHAIERLQFIADRPAKLGERRFQPAAAAGGHRGGALEAGTLSSASVAMDFPAG